MSKEDQQPLIENNENDNTTIGINYDSINYSMINEGDVSISNEIENPEGCTAPQASFNMINLLAGLGIMSIPYCLKIGGAIPSVFFLIVLGFTAKYTARLIGKCIQKDNSINSLAIMGLKLFGKTGCTVISTFFIFDLFFSMMANLILVKDTLHLVFPAIPPYVCLLIAYSCCVSLTWIKKLVTLSWVSLIGLLSMFALFVILVFNGLVTPNAPGSLLERQELNMWPESFLGFCTILGIFEMGYSGHSVLPSIYLSLKKRKNFKSVLNVSFSWIIIFYLMFGFSGALMYGQQTLPQIVQNIHSTLNSKTYFLGTLISWIIIVVPITKFALVMDPIAVASTEFIKSKFQKVNTDTRAFFVTLRTILATLVLLASILIPKFHSVLGIIGAALTSVTGLMFPILSYLKMYPDANRPLHYLLFAFTLVVSILGTIGAFASLKN
jgi:vesicular inhibitory amino acid transporter